MSCFPQLYRQLYNHGAELKLSRRGAHRSAEELNCSIERIVAQHRVCGQRWRPVLRAAGPEIANTGRSQNTNHVIYFRQNIFHYSKTTEDSRRTSIHHPSSGLHVAPAARLRLAVGQLDLARSHCSSPWPNPAQRSTLESLISGQRQARNLKLVRFGYKPDFMRYCP